MTACQTEKAGQVQLINGEINTLMTKAWLKYSDSMFL